MIVVRALYGLRSSGAVFRVLIAEVSHDIGYKPIKADPNVYLGPAVKSNGSKYYDYVLCYVDDVLGISKKTMTTMQGIQHKFKLKDNKIEPPEMYLSAGLNRIINETNHECWEMSSDKYCKAAVANIEEILKKKILDYLQNSQPH